MELPGWMRRVAAERPGSVLLETARFDEENRRSLLFVEPVRVLEARRLAEMPELFRGVEEALVEGCFVAGYVGYECGYHFEGIAAAVDAGAEEMPLAWFGVYRECVSFDHASGELLEGDAAGDAGAFAEAVGLSISRKEYGERIAKIKEYIAAGETYQVNFTDSVRVRTELSAEAAFGALMRQQPVAYGALLNVAGRHVLSLSPELFFRIEDGRIVTRPMKGTMPRGLDVAEDAEQMLRLARDEKNRAEHVMIVDLLRNDLGRVCEMGSVEVDDLFRVEKYATLLQMTSTVSGRLRPGLSYYEIFKGIFPSGSITGAPKHRTMEIIRELERGPRGVYTGAIGYFAPGGRATFNVAIRTLVLQDGEAAMGVGGGIVADSKASDEYEECLLKAGFLARRREFELIETMLWEGEYFLLEMHLDRLAGSAEYFGFVCDRDAVATQVMEAAKEFQPGERVRVRLLLDARGSTKITSTKLTEAPGGRVKVSRERVDSGDVWLRHKTTERGLYDREFVAARAEGFDEVIFLNERGEITEGAISNVFVRVDGKLFTPPLESGVLPGIYRQHLLETGAEERVLTLADLRGAEVFLGNSVRGMWRVTSLE